MGRRNLRRAAVCRIRGGKASLLVPAGPSLAENSSFRRSRFQGADQFTLPIFVLTGALLPWSAWLDPGWMLLAFALAVLALRQPLAILLLIPFLKIKQRDAMFFGWFGPVGVAAIYYALHAEETLHDPRIWAIASAVVVVSVLLHGVTASPGVLLYGRRMSPARQEENAAKPASA